MWVTSCDAVLVDSCHMTPYFLHDMRYQFSSVKFKGGRSTIPAVPYTSEDNIMMCLEGVMIWKEFLEVAVMRLFSDAVDACEEGIVVGRVAGRHGMFPRKRSWTCSWTSTWQAQSHTLTKN